MEILEQCKDDNTFTLSSEPILYETNTYYPPGKEIKLTDTSKHILSWGKGTVCARNLFQQSCFYSGESGSPLMTR